MKTPLAVRDATLPAKIEAARHYIAQCTDLSELLKLKSQAEGLAAAVRVMKHVGPEMVRNANEMMADAWRQGGKLLSAYSSVAGSPKGRKFKRTSDGKIVGDSGGFPSPRSIVAESLGISRVESTAMVRVYKASENVAYDAVQKTSCLGKAARLVPAVNPLLGGGPKAYSDRCIGITRELANAKAAVRRIPLASFQHLTPDERVIVKAKIVEIGTLLAEMHTLCE